MSDQTKFVNCGEKNTYTIMLSQLPYKNEKETEKLCVTSFNKIHHMHP